MTWLALKPIWGIDYTFGEEENIYHRWGGLSFEARVGTHFSMYASLRDNKESEILSKESFLVNRIGANYKATEYSDMRGGLNYKWKWGYISLVKDHLSWGSAYNGSNIISNRAPSFSQIKLKLTPVEWLDFDYMHGWLVSNVVDSTNSYVTSNGIKRDILHPKYIAANFFTFTPAKNIHFSVGNSVVYSANTPHPAYLTPLFFYKSVDHWLNSTDGAGSYVGQNSQMFLNFSVYRLKGYHLYGSLFVDEFKFDRVNDPDSHNFWSYKIGLKQELFNLGNFYLTTEYTRTNPNTYQHNISTTTFESNDYNMGHYLRDNSDELFLCFTYKPLDKVRSKLSYTMARKGEEYGYINGSNAIKHAFLEDVKWKQERITFQLEYELLYNTYVSAAYQYISSEGEYVAEFTPQFYSDANKHYFNVAFIMGR